MKVVGNLARNLFSMVWWLGSGLDSFAPMDCIRAYSEAEDNNDPVSSTYNRFHNNNKNQPSRESQGVRSTLGPITSLLGPITIESQLGSITISNWDPLLFQIANWDRIANWDPMTRPITISAKQGLSSIASRLTKSQSFIHWTSSQFFSILDRMHNKTNFRQSKI